MSKSERHAEIVTNVEERFIAVESHLSAISLADPGAPPPLQQGPILSFSHTCLPKSAHIGTKRCWHPLREILDSPVYVPINEGLRILTKV